MTDSTCLFLQSSFLMTIFILILKPISLKASHFENTVKTEKLTVIL